MKYNNDLYVHVDLLLTCSDSNNIKFLAGFPQTILGDSPTAIMDPLPSPTLLPHPPECVCNETTSPKLTIKDGI